MSASELRSLSDLLREVIQLAYVTDDIAAGVEWLQDTLGTSPCHVMYASSLGGTVVVDGEVADEWVIDVALVNAGPTNIELIRPVSGAVAMYRDGIRPGAPATFHHLGVRVDDLDAATALIEAHGRSWEQHGTMQGAIRFGYLDMTAELGHRIEVMELLPGMRQMLDLLEEESDRPARARPPSAPS
ncbi:VOC family protein [Dermatobacter hominis]|uniref:VOC family protein n=1 Tax=Dermatobacter hominis TaxID=2884263 RepID=UPI001D110F13|nr:VOC family protein [Dermatobacter hominis]UDY36692.1 VOC family protein [Dermatobacter hominis]